MSVVFRVSGFRKCIAAKVQKYRTQVGSRELGTTKIAGHLDLDILDSS